MTSKLLLDESPLLVLPTLAQKIGLSESIVLQQVHYWLNPAHNSNVFQGKHWVYNTYEQWQRQFSFWSLKTIRRIIKNLEEQKLLISFVTQDFKKTKYYTIDYEQLDALEKGREPVDGVTASELIDPIEETVQTEQITLPKSTDGPDNLENQDLCLQKRNNLPVADRSEDLTEISKHPKITTGSEANKFNHLPKWADRSGQSDQTVANFSNLIGPF